MAVVRTEYVYVVAFQSFQECPHQKLFFDLKDKNYKKPKMKGGLGWMKNIGNDPRSFFNGNHFSSVIGLVSVYIDITLITRVSVKYVIVITRPRILWPVIV